MDEDVENFINCGADLVLTKPLKMNQLEALLNHCKRNGFDSIVDGTISYHLNNVNSFSYIIIFIL
jgi:DNA-binding response OmpR family regulator